MRHIQSHHLAANRRAQSQASFTAMELASQQQAARDKVQQARDKLRDVITATGVPAFKGVAILAAAETFAKATKMAALAMPLAADPDPAIAIPSVDPDSSVASSVGASSGDEAQELPHGVA